MSFLKVRDGHLLLNLAAIPAIEYNTTKTEARIMMPSGPSYVLTGKDLEVLAKALADTQPPKLEVSGLKAKDILEKFHDVAVTSSPLEAPKLPTNVLRPVGQPAKHQKSARPSAPENK